MSNLRGYQMDNIRKSVELKESIRNKTPKALPALEEAKKKRDEIMELARKQGGHVKSTTEFKGDEERYVSVTVTYRVNDK